ELDRRAIRQFLASGGALLATGCGGASFLTSMAPARDGPVTAKSRVRARESGPLTAGASEIGMAKECADPHLGNEYRALYGGDDGAVRVARMGEGVVQWW